MAIVSVRLGDGMQGQHPKPIDFVVDANGCFVVTSHRPMPDGYCEFRFYNRRIKAHRFIYEECFGFVPDGLHVLHKCDNPPCINPEHLFLGTNQDNIDDKVRKGRQLKGEQIPVSKLKEHEAMAILLDKISSARELAERYGVLRGAIWRIKNRTRWAHLTPKLEAGL